MNGVNNWLLVYQAIHNPIDGKIDRFITGNLTLLLKPWPLKSLIFPLKNAFSIANCWHNERVISINIPHVHTLSTKQTILFIPGHNCSLLHHIAGSQRGHLPRPWWTASTLHGVRRQTLATLATRERLTPLRRWFPHGWIKMYGLSWKIPLKYGSVLSHGIPLDYSKLDHFSLETHGDLGIPFAETFIWPTDMEVATANTEGSTMKRKDFTICWLGNWDLYGFTWENYQSNETTLYIGDFKIWIHVWISFECLQSITDEQFLTVNPRFGVQGGHRKRET